MSVELMADAIFDFALQTNMDAVTEQECQFMANTGKKINFYHGFYKYFANVK
jgi:hypothetical protein